MPPSTVLEDQSASTAPALNCRPASQISQKSQAAAWKTSVHVWIAVAVLLLIHTGLLAYSATRHSPTLLEPASLAAGISHWEFGRFEFYRVNPPLVKMVAALPVMGAGYEMDWSEFHDAPGARPEFSMGAAFIKANGERSIWLLTIARWACIPFSLIGALFCFLWSRELWEHNAAGLISLTLWCFEPNILAHAELITTDCAAASFGVGAAYFFWRWLRRPRWQRALSAGFLLGLAQLSKMTWIILLGLWPLLWVIWLVAHRRPTGTVNESPQVTTKGQFAQLSAILVLGIYFLNLGYAFDGTFTPLKDFTFISTSLTGLQESGELGNRFSESALVGDLPIPLPKQYLCGLDAQKHDFEHFEHKSYLRGEWRDRGWWYYYLYGLLVKLPHGTQLLVILASALALRHALRRTGPAGGADLLVLLLPAIVVFVLVSAQSEFNHHFRYVLLSFGAAFVLSGSVCVARHLIFQAAALACLLATAFACAANYPHSLSYFNEFAGGRENGGRHLLHSSLDWGQGLLELDRLLDQHSDWGPVAIAYSGPISPEWLGSRARPIDWYRHPSPLNGCSHVAISANILAGESRAFPWYLRPPNAATEFESFFRNRQPVDTLDGSIHVFDARGFTDFYESSHSVAVNALGVLSHSTRESNSLSADLPTLADAAGIEDVSVSGCLHILLLHGMGETGLRSPVSGQEALRLLTDERLANAAFGKSPFVRTRDGVRYRLAGSQADGHSQVGESHRDQCLCTFAALNLSLDEPMTLESEQLTFRSLLDESIANFTFHQGELAWTAQAYVYYLSPARSWTDRFGKTTSFSELLTEIMDRGYVGQSCAGLHVLQTVAITVEADDRFGLLDRPTRTRAREFLASALADLEASQRPDGSWDWGWTASLTATHAEPRTFSSRFLATGHMLELLQNLRDSPAELRASAATWLMNSMMADDFRQQNISVCPLTHALRATRNETANQRASHELAAPDVRR